MAKLHNIRKVLLYGILVWIVPFIVAMIMYPLRDSQRQLFESIMSVVIVFITIEMSFYYLRDLKKNFAKEAFLVGFIWLFMSILIDLPLFLFGGSMQMDFFEYMSDIGTTYFVIPVITTGFGYFAQQVHKNKKK